MTSPYFNDNNFFNAMVRILLLFPPFSFSSCVRGFISIVFDKNRCKLCKLPDYKCSETLESYFQFKSDNNPYGMLEETLFLLLSGVLFAAIILLFDYKIFARILQWGLNLIVGTEIGEQDHHEDPDVGVERDNVKAAKTRFCNNTHQQISNNRIK